MHKHLLLLLYLLLAYPSNSSNLLPGFKFQCLTIFIGIVVLRLAKLGVKAGFKVYADLEGWREEGLPFVLEEDKLKRISKIDVIWHDNNDALYEFEVENTTTISDAIIRGSHIPSKKN